MTHLINIIAVVAHCNFHFCVYGAFGTLFLSQAALLWSERRPAEAREHFVHGMVYFSLGLLQ